MSDCGCKGLRYVGRTGREMRWTDWAVITPDDAEAHTDGDVVSGALTFGCAVLSTGGTGRIAEVILMERGDVTNLPEKAALDLILYNGLPTPAAQNAAYSAPADLGTVIGRIAIPEAAWADLDGVTAIARVTPDHEIQAASGETTIYGVLVTPGTPEWTDAEVQSLRIQLRIARD